MRYPLASSGLRAQDIDRVIEVLNSGRLTMGDCVKRFESEMAAYTGTSHFIMTNSGSSANLAIIESLLRPSNGQGKLSLGDSVLVPIIAWPTTIWPLIQLGLKPVFVDVDPETLAIDLASAQEIITNSIDNSIRAIFPIHPLGYPLDEKTFQSFASKNNLIFISDTCEALGSFRGSEHAGSRSIASSFSFYFSHHITTMEGGGVATNDDVLADDLRSIRSHGWSRDRSDANLWANKRDPSDARFLFVSAGFNIRPMEIQAAIGSLQLEDIEMFIKRRIEIVNYVQSNLINTNFRVLGSSQEDLNRDSIRHSRMLIPIVLDARLNASYRSQVLRILEADGVETRPVLTGNFLAQPAMQNLNFSHQKIHDFPMANDITARSFLVGAHHDVTDAQVEHLILSLKRAHLQSK